jgi:hypothetical protein
MGITKTIVSAAISKENLLHVEKWREGLSFSASLNQILDEHRFLVGMGIVAREVNAFQLLSPKCSVVPKADEEDVA